MSVLPQPAKGLPAYAGGLVLVAASTVLGLLIAPRWGTGAVDLIFLPAVIATAAFAGRGPAFVGAIGSALAYNYFFTAPYHTFRVHSPADLVTVLILLLVALVTSHLASSIRTQAKRAEAHAARNATIAGLARRLLSCGTQKEIAQTSVAEIAGLFACNAALLSDASAPHIVSAQPADVTLAPSDLASASVVLSGGEAIGRGLSGVTTIDWQIHPVRSGHQVLAALALARNDGLPPVSADEMSLLGSLLDQIALALERARLEQETREFAAVRERDRMRSALLSTIGDDLAPRVAAIAAAATALRRNAGADKAELGVVSSEAARLQRYLDNLLELGPAPDQKPIEALGVVIDLARRTVLRNGEPVHLTPKEYAVLAELAKYPGRVLNHAHLMKSAWGPAYERQTEYLRVAVRALRQKLENDPANPKLIVNEPAVGYRLAA